MYSLDLLLRTGCKGCSKMVKIPRLRPFSFYSILIFKLRQGVSSNVNFFISLGLPVATMKIGSDSNTGAKNLYLCPKGLKVLDDIVKTTVKGKPEIKKKVYPTQW